MNKVHRIVWSAIRGAFIVAHEKANSHGKPSSTRKAAATALMTALLGTSGFVLAAPPINTLPTNGQIVGGAAAGNIATNGNAMTVTQNQQRMVANWESYSIGSNASVHYQQPTGGVALNRVTGTAPSEIFGRLSATGSVYLLNSAGIVFGRGAQVDVGALVASTGKMSDSDFLAGRMRIVQEGSGGKILNEGELKAAMDGYIALLAPEVRNQGVIFAQKGTVALAAGQAYELQFDGTKLANVRVEPAAFSVLVKNGNAVEAPGGLIILSAHAVNRLQSAVIRNNGTLDASSMTSKGGRIILESSERIDNTGSIKASGGTTQAGGSVEISAPQINLGGMVDVSGSTGGSLSVKASESLTLSGQIDARGRVDRGGDVQLKQAQTLVQQTPSRIDVSGITQGGTVSAEAANTLTVEGSIDASASNGAGGTVDLAGGTKTTLNNASIDASGSTQGGQIRVSALAETRNTLLDPNNPINDPTAPGTPTQVAITGSSTLRSNSRRGKGGNIQITGDDILLGNGSLLEASGETGGGTVLVGGDWQGSNGVYQAATVHMEKGAKIDVSAIKNGSGGKAVLWSDITKDGGLTRVDGEILAKGGSEAGNIENAGGKVETSGHKLTIGDNASVNTSGASGAPSGLWLLDPFDFTIGTDITGAALTTALETGGSGQTVSISTHVTTGLTDPAYYGTTGTSGDIIINDSFGWSKGTLVLDANRSILVNNAVNVSGTGGLTVRANLGNYTDALGNGTSTGTRAGYLKFKQNRNGLTGTDTFDGKLNWTSSGALKINSATPYTIISAISGTAGTDLNEIGGGTGNYALAGNLDLSNAVWTPLASFGGTLEGLGHTISNFSIAGDTGNGESAGFIKVANIGTTLQNIGLVNAQVVGNTSSGTGAFIGKITMTGGTVSLRNLFVDATSTVTSGVTNLSIFGGLVGSINSTAADYVNVIDGYNAAKIYSKVDSLSFAGGVIGDIDSGGAAGRQFRLVMMDVYNVGEIMGGTLTSKNGGNFVGGFTSRIIVRAPGGYTYLENLRNYKDISSGSYVGGVAGQVTSNGASAASGNVYAYLITNYGAISGAGSNGGIFGYATAEAGDPAVDGSTQRVIILSGVTNKGVVTSTGAAAGGIIGNAYSGYGHEIRLSNVVNEANISGTQDVGGLIGKARHSSGQTTSDDTTYSTVKITDAVNSGAVYGSATGYVGGLIGYFEANKLALTNVYNLGTVTTGGTATGKLGALFGGMTYASTSSGLLLNDVYAINGKVAGDVLTGYYAPIGQTAVSNATTMGMPGVGVTNTLAAGNNVAVADADFKAATLAQLGFSVDSTKWTGGGGSYASLVGRATPIYLKLTDGTSVYGTNPVSSYVWGYYTSANGTGVVTDASPTGTITWSTALSGTSNATTYSLTYGSGISLGNSLYSLAAGSAGSWIVTAKPLALTSSSFTVSNKTYDGSTTAALTGSAVVNGAGLVGSDTVPTITAQAGTFASKNVGTGVAVTANLTLSNPNYSIDPASLPSGLTGNITRLNSVTWTGGASTNNWLTPGNWTGGAVPDQANVANVVIPNGATVTFDNATVVGVAQAGTVALDGINTSNTGALTMTSGTLQVANNLQIGAFSQGGGSVAVGGNFTAAGAVSQTAGTLTVTGTTGITAGANAINLASSTNNFGGTVSVSNTGANNISLSDADGIQLGAISTAGNLDVRAAGDINVNQAVTVPTAQTFTLYAITGSGKLNINAPISVNGSGTLIFKYANNQDPYGYYLSSGISINLNAASTFKVQTGVDSSPQPYTTITTAAELIALGASTAVADTGKNFALANDIDLASAAFLPIGGSTTSYSPYGYTFAGLGHQIKNLSISLATNASTTHRDDAAVGLFSTVASNGMIRDVGLVGGTVIGDKAASGGAWKTTAGGLVGNLAGKIFNSYSTVNVQSGRAAGGLVGNVTSAGSVIQSYATGDVSIPTDSLNTTYSHFSGGLVGQSYGIISQSYATGAVTGYSNGTTPNAVGGLAGGNSGNSNTLGIFDSYATGSVTGGSANAYVGGLIGDGGSLVTRSYATGAVSGGGATTMGGIGGIFSTDKFPIYNYWDTTMSFPRNFVCQG